MDALSDFDQQRLEQLHVLMHNALDTLYEIDRKLAVETRPLERRQLRQQADQVREDYNRYREEYAVLLRMELSTRFAPDEQALLHAILQRLNSDQLAVTRTALQEADRHPDDPAFAQLSAEVVSALPSVQQQLAAKNTPAANQIAQVAHVLQTPTADIKQKLKLCIPLVPLCLAYETEFNLNIPENLKLVWGRLKEQLRPS